MQAEMSLTQLLKLQKNYFDLARRIGNQPEGEREYDADVSLDTSFLE